MNRHPFTFVEVFAAMLVVALVVPVALRGVSLARQLVGDDMQYERAVRLADYRLNEVQVLGEWERGDSEGVFADDPDFHWMLRTEPYAGPGSLPLTVLRLTVSRPGAARPTAVTLVSLVASGTIEGGW